jgi:carboxypeptidase family protein
VRRLVLISAAMLLLSALLCAQSREKKAEEAAAPRDLTGMVFDKAHHPVSDAIVYLKNTRSLAIHTYITGGDGSYRFNHLSPDSEYQVRAESGSHKSAVRSLSSFDTHKQPRINLKLGK